jgi:rhodanese-related sulfurtransferase
MGFFSLLFGTPDNKLLVETINKGAFLVDVRSPREFSSGSVKGAVNIPLDSLPQQLAKFKGKENIVVFCRSGNRSSTAKSILAQNGYPHVLDGGTWRNVSKVLTNR